MDYLKKAGFKGSINHIEVDPDNHTEGREKLERILKESKVPIGGVVFNSRMYELIKMLNKVDDGLKQKLCLIGHDAIEGNVEALKKGQVNFLLSQRPDFQGYDAVKALANYRLFTQIPDKNNFMPIDILIKENVDYYKNYKL
jgi:LacI family transcriptional regulator